MFLPNEFYSLGTKRDRPIWVISSNLLEQAGVQGFTRQECTLRHGLLLQRTMLHKGV